MNEEINALVLEAAQEAVQAERKRQLGVRKAERDRWLARIGMTPQEYDRNWRANNPEAARRKSRKGWLALRDDPDRLAVYRQRERERMSQKRSSPGYAEIRKEINAKATLDYKKRIADPAYVKARREMQREYMKKRQLADPDFQNRRNAAARERQAKKKEGTK